MVQKPKMPHACRRIVLMCSSFLEFQCSLNSLAIQLHLTFSCKIQIWCTRANLHFHSSPQLNTKKSPPRWDSNHNRLCNKEQVSSRVSGSGYKFASLKTTFLNTPTQIPKSFSVMWHASFLGTFLNSPWTILA